MMKLALPIVAAAAAMAVSAPAHAAAVVTLDSDTFDGDFENAFLAPADGDTAVNPTVNISYNDGLAAPSIEETLVFSLTDIAFAEFDFSATPEDDFSFTTFELTGGTLGSPLNLLSLTTGGDNIHVSLGAGTYTLSLIGSNGKSVPSGNYNGNIAFTAVPEPATWMMLLLGFFGAGLMLRRKESFNSDQTMRVTYS